MSELRYLSIRDFRNISHIEIQPSTQGNWICGSNGAGKTSILEAIAYLSLGRSFLTRKVTRLVNRDTRFFVLNAHVVPVGQDHDLVDRVGIENGSRHAKLVKINGESVRSASTLLRLFHVLVADAKAFNLLGGVARQRRSLMDWIVFHVKHDFHEIFSNLKRGLDQRNAMLKIATATADDTSYWHHQIADNATRVNNYRSEVIQQLLVHVRVYLRRILTQALEPISDSDLDTLELRFDLGFDVDRCIELLVNNFQDDKALGYTRIGPHRGDFKVLIRGWPAEEYLSRGQQKTLVLSLLLGAAAMLKEKGLAPTFLLDDLPAELDHRMLSTLLSEIDKMGCQYFVSSIRSPNEISGLCLPESSKVFHVKHGCVSEANSSH